MTPAAIDELLRKLDFVAKSFNAEKLGLPIPGANEELRAVVDQWLAGSALRCEHSDNGLHQCKECDAEWAAGQMPVTHHCNICGGEVDLSNASKPTEKVGRGPKFEQTDSPDEGIMKGKSP